jgi:hypothetical protein
MNDCTNKPPERSPYGTPPWAVPSLTHRLELAQEEQERQGHSRLAVLLTETIEFLRAGGQATGAYRLDIDESAIYDGDRRVLELDTGGGVGNNSNDNWRAAIALGARLVDAMNGSAPAPFAWAVYQANVKAPRVVFDQEEAESAAAYLGDLWVGTTPLYTTAGVPASVEAQALKRLRAALVDANVKFPGDDGTKGAEFLAACNEARALTAGVAPSEARQRKADERMRHDYPLLQQFHSKHAMGAKAAPSCLCCGQQTHPVTRPIAVQHLELPAIVVCKPCKDATGVATCAGSCCDCGKGCTAAGVKGLDDGR